MSLRGSKQQEQDSRRLPLYILTKNSITVSQKAVSLLDGLQLDFQCNALSASQPWNQPRGDFSVYTALDNPSKCFSSQYENVIYFQINPNATSSLSVTPAPTPITVVNSWIALNSNSMPCDGLVNLIGTIQFVTTHCANIQSSPPLSSVPVTVPDFDLGVEIGAAAIGGALAKTGSLLTIMTLLPGATSLMPY